MIKVKIAEDVATMSHSFYIYHEDSKGNITFASPMDIVFGEEYSKPGMCVKPTFSIDSHAFQLAIQNAPHITDQMIKQKDSDKNFHIKSLETIVEKLINRGINV